MYRPGPRPWGVGRGTVLAVLVALGAAPAGATTLCANRAGKVAVRETCKRRERVVPAAEVGLVGEAGAQGPTGASGAAGMVPNQVIDAAGRPFGTLVQYLGTAQTVVQLPGVAVPLQFKIAYGQFVLDSTEESVYYEAADCTGSPLITGGGSVVPVARAVGTRGYFSLSPATMRSVGSREYVSDHCGTATPTARGTCCSSLNEMLPLSPAETFDPATLGVTLPFSLVPR